jgi:hypothetical protein
MAQCSSGTPEIVPATPATSNRVARSFACRLASAGQDAFIPTLQQIDNGDEALYTDKSGTYTKGILQTGIGLVDLEAYKTFKTALSTGDPADFENITVGGSGMGFHTQNGPQGGLAFNLDCLDSAQFTKPPAPAVASEDYAAELVELYWASLLRDVAFTGYPTDPTAIAAADELSKPALSCYKGPRDPTTGKVTPELLFRGGFGADPNAFKDETVGPYISQFLLQSTYLGAPRPPAAGMPQPAAGLPIDQRYITFKATTSSENNDFMLDKDEFQKVQNGIDTGRKLQPVLDGSGPSARPKPLYLHDGRGLASLTHADVLYQEFLLAYLLLDSLGVPFNPGNPYGGSAGKTGKQNGFNTFGGPDIASTLAHVANEALNVVWYQKWYVHLRHRPESGGALVNDNLSHLNVTEASGDLSSTVLTSNAVSQSHTKNNSYFLSQAFPEGSPYHPAYPTGHGTVAGACITALKFFYDADRDWKTATNNNKPQEPDPGPPGGPNPWTTLRNYGGSDVDKLTVNGELHKLAHNVSFGHGIHAGIHWRSDTDTSIQLGEAVALSILQDRAHTYNEKFTVKLRKVDGSIATITNQ